MTWILTRSGQNFDLLNPTAAMTVLRRTVQIRHEQMPPLDLQTVCDKCNKSRAHGNHELCSKQRQAEGIARRAGEKPQ